MSDFHAKLYPKAFKTNILEPSLSIKDPLSIEPFESLDTEGVFLFLYLTFEVEDLYDTT